MLIQVFVHISDYTDLATSSITQRQIINFRAPFNIVYYCLQTLAGKVDKLEVQGKPAFRVFDSILIIQEKGAVIIEVCHNLVFYPVWNLGPFFARYGKPSRDPPPQRIYAACIYIYLSKIECMRFFQGVIAYILVSYLFFIFFHFFPVAIQPS